MNTQTATLNALLSAAGDRLDQIAGEHRLSREQIAAMHTARLAADFLYDLAEAFARGDDLGNVLGNPAAVLPASRSGLLNVLQDKSHVCPVCA